MANKSIKELVNKYLVEVPQTRNNDNLLIAYVLKEMFGSCNMQDVALATKSSVCGSIIRERAKIQNEINPNLQADEPVRLARNEKAIKTKEKMRCL